MAVDKLPVQGNPGRPIRVAHLQLLPLMSGVQRVTLDELSRLDRSLFEPYVICKEEGPFTSALKAANIPYFCIPELMREISPLHDLKAFFRLVRLFREQRFDVVHTHSSKTGILGRLAGKWAGVPLVMHTVHGYAFPAAKNVLQRAFYYLMEWLGARFTDVLIVSNKNDFETAKKRLRVPLGKLRLIPNGVDIARYAPLSPGQRSQIRREVFGVEENQVAIGMVGRLWPQKNPELFIRTAIQLLKEMPASVRFFLIGDGEEKQKLEDLIKTSGFEKKINLLGWRDNVDRLLGGLDIFVLPSRWEGMPLAILEAMSTSLPVVASKIPGNMDLVENGVDGFLFELNDESNFSGLLTKLINDPKLRKNIGAAGLIKVRNYFTLAERTEKIKKIYSEFLSTKSSK